MPTDSDRTVALRRELVQAVVSHVSPRRRVVALSLAAFVAGAALTGGVSAAAVSQLSSSYTQSTGEWVLSMARPNSVLVGEVQRLETTGDGSIDLGPAPEGATGLAISLGCLEAGEVRIMVDDVFAFSRACDGPTGKGGTGWRPAERERHTLRVSTAATVSYELWVAWVKSPPLSEMSSQQSLELADGVVSRDEYIAAYSRYIGCMGAAGYDLSAASQTSTVFSYAVPAEAVTDGSDERCYLSQFQGVDAAWQVANEDTSESADVLRACLVANGLPPKPTMAQLLADLEAAGIDLATCV